MASEQNQLAKRIARYTTNGLLTAVVLVAGLGFGRQVLRWWAADRSGPAATQPAQAPDGLGDPARLHLLQFSDQSWSLCRQSIAGDKRAAAAALRNEQELGFAVPMGPDAWTLWTFQPAGAAGRQFPALPQIPLPPECRRTLSMQVAGGGAVVGFEGPQPRAWAAFYDRWSARYNWKRMGNWQHSGTTWHARYIAPGPDPAGSVDVHFGADGRGQASGVLMIDRPFSRRACPARWPVSIRSNANAPGKPGG